MMIQLIQSRPYAGQVVLVRFEEHEKTSYQFMGVTSVSKLQSEQVVSRLCQLRGPRDRLEAHSDLKCRSEVITRKKSIRKANFLGAISSTLF